MKHETAQQILELLLKHSKEQNDVLQKINNEESYVEFERVKSMIGRTMGSMYLDAIHPILTEHPDLTPIQLQKSK